MKKKVNIYLSADPNQKFSREILQYTYLKGIRYNTGVPVTDSKSQLLANFQNVIYPIEAWIDLKGRELRNIKEAVVPKDNLELNHQIEVDTPTALYYNEGRNSVLIDKVIDGNKIYIRTPDNFSGNEFITFGKGCSLNIPDNSLKIKDYFTESDKEYIEAAKKKNIHNYFLSYVESKSDMKSLYQLDPKANVYAKIESKKGLDFIQNEYHDFSGKVHLIAARADLYIELDKPHHILDALKKIIKKDPNAIAASHILESFMELDKIPNCEDICDLGFLLELGYRNFLLGDDICKHEEAILATFGLFSELIK